MEKCSIDMLIIIIIIIIINILYNITTFVPTWSSSGNCQE